MASNDELSEKTRKSSDISKLPPVVLSKELHSLIGTVKEMQLITTYEEVLEGLGKYIAKKNLYNPYSMKICCKDDGLGSLLGTEEFAVSELNTILPKLAVPVSLISKDSAQGASLPSDNPLKRKLDENLETVQKKIPAVSTSPMILHIPPSPTYDVSDSVDSIQGYETAYVKDTSDEFLSTENGEEKILAIEETYNIEYEVQSDSSDSTFDDNSSDSDSDEHEQLKEAVLKYLTKVLYKPKPDSDIEFFADASSDEDDKSDAEISESDFWSCSKCNIKNKPTVRYCLKCFEQRRNWLPDKPSNMRRKRRKFSASAKNTGELSKASILKCDQDSQGSNSLSEVSCEIKENSSKSSSLNMESVISCNVELIDSPSTESIDSPCLEYFDSTCVESLDSLCMKSPGSSSMVSSGLSSMESSGPSSMKSPYPSSMKSPCSSGIESSGPSSMKSQCSSSMESIIPSSMESTGPSSMESTGPSSMESSGFSSMKSSDSCIEKLCMLCCSEPIDASIIHGRFAHEISCYKCARRLKKEKKDCPVCRRAIERVVFRIHSW